jgi:hypothetical protein
MDGNVLCYTVIVVSARSRISDALASSPRAEPALPLTMTQTTGVMLLAPGGQTPLTDRCHPDFFTPIVYGPVAAGSL